jgi:hypothetical protein
MARREVAPSAWILAMIGCKSAAQRTPRATCVLPERSHAGAAQSEIRPSASVPDTDGGAIGA